MSGRAAFTVVTVLIAAALLVTLAWHRTVAPSGSLANSQRHFQAGKPSIAEWFSIIPATRLVPNTRTSFSVSGQPAPKLAGASLAPTSQGLSAHELFHGALLAAVMPGAPSVSVPAQQQMLADLNTTRAQRRLPALKLDRRLSRVALAHARDMVQHGFFAHESSNGDSPFLRMR